MDMLSITHYLEMNVETFIELKWAFLSLFIAWNKTLFLSKWNGHFCHHALPWNQYSNLFSCWNSHFWAYVRCVKLTFCGVASYQCPCRRREPVHCYDKPRRDFHLKQRPALAYYNKGSAWFIITKVFFSYVISRKWRAIQRKKLPSNVC